jgi:hypothetical protein
MLRRLIVVILTVWTLSPALAEPVFPVGSRVGMEPPAGLALSKRIPGFEDVERKVTITILDLPARAYEDLERSAFVKDQPGLGDLQRESFPFESGVGFLVKGSTQENGVTMHKWFLLATPISSKVQDLAMLINVQVPESARAVYTDAIIRKALASVTFRPAPIQEQLGLMPFKLGEMAGFRVMQVLPAGGVILTDGPLDDINSQPYMIISIGPGAPGETDDRAKFAREMLSGAPLRDLTVQSSEAMRINGGAGHEIRAAARGLTDDPLSLVQWIRFGGGGFLRIIGVSHTDQWNEYFTRFRAVRDGIEPK